MAAQHRLCSAGGVSDRCESPREHCLGLAALLDRHLFDAVGLDVRQEVAEGDLGRRRLLLLEHGHQQQDDDEDGDPEGHVLVELLIHALPPPLGSSPRGAITRVEIVSGSPTERGNPDSGPQFRSDCDAATQPRCR